MITVENASGLANDWTWPRACGSITSTCRRFINDQQIMNAELETPYAILHDKKITGVRDLLPILKKVMTSAKFVEQDGRLRGVTMHRVTKRLPHFHHRQTHASALLSMEQSMELIHALRAAILTPEPDRTTPFHVADHDTIGVAFTNRDLIPNDLGSRSAGDLRRGARQCRGRWDQYLAEPKTDRAWHGHGLSADFQSAEKSIQRTLNVLLAECVAGQPYLLRLIRRPRPQHEV